MNQETVKVTIEVTKGIDSFVRRVAALEGSTAKDWYESWIDWQFKAIVENRFQIDGLNEQRMFELYCHEPY